MSIRLRLAAAFTLAAATLFALGAWLFVATLSSTMLASIDSQLATNLGLADRYVGSGSATTSDRQLAGEYLLQLIDASGTVQGASGDAGGVPLLPEADRRQAMRGRVAVTRTIDGEGTRLVAEPYRARPGWVAVSAVSLEPYDRTLTDLEGALVGGGIGVVVLAAVGSWLLARAALAPVERMRREVADLAQRTDEVTLQVPSTRDELAALAATMNELLHRLHAALERQRAFVADASHELRTPFAVLAGELELASRPGRTQAELVAAVANAADEAARLNRLTTDLLVLARSDSDQLTLRRGQVDVRALLERSAESARERSARSGVRVEVDADSPLTGWVDPDRVREAVDNLVDNALRFAPPESTVVLRGAVHDADLTIEVLDRGPGFPPDFLPHAFERFSRPGAARTRNDGGAGLGLAIVQAIAAAHGGSAAAVNRPGGGAAVRITFPASS